MVLWSLDLEASMPTLSIPRPEGDVTVEIGYDEYGRLLIGSSENCHIQIPGLRPVHAYLAEKSDHVDLFLAPGEGLVCNGREVRADPVPFERVLLEQYCMVARSPILVEIGGVRVEEGRSD
jgi:hypothetical protein